ncbi:hypothetical protein B0H10DRAFT_2230583 [Mycena sp. CBHHK59/15]|nr:hypothetical protein B0H10DRAFT_2230583 [Mycena sp. CBHHK59/15]
MYTPARTPCIRRTLCDSPSTPSTRTPTSIPRPPASPASASSLPSDSLRLRTLRLPLPSTRPTLRPNSVRALCMSDPSSPVDPQPARAYPAPVWQLAHSSPALPTTAADDPPSCPHSSMCPTAADSFKLSTDRRTAMKCHLNPYVLRLLAALGSIARRTARRDQRRGTAPRRCRAHVYRLREPVQDDVRVPEADTLSEFSLSDSSDDSYHPEPEPDSDCAALCPKRKRRLRTLPEATVFYGPASRWLRKVCKKMRRRSRDAHACVRISPPPALIPRHNHSHNPDDSKSLCALVKFDAALASVPALLGKCGSLGWTWWADAIDVQFSDRRWIKVIAEAGSRRLYVAPLAQLHWRHHEFRGGPTPQLPRIRDTYGLNALALPAVCGTRRAALLANLGGAVLHNIARIWLAPHGSAASGAARPHDGVGSDVRASRTWSSHSTSVSQLATLRQ